MGGRGGTLSSGGGGGGAATAERTPLGSVSVGGKEYELTGTIVDKFIFGSISTIEIEISTPGLFNGRAFGGVEFKIDSASKTARIVSINSVQALRGQGVGERIYGAAFAEAKSRGVQTFNSDKNVSLPAAKTWREIGNKIGNVKENASTNDGQQLTSKRGGPVFSLNLGKVSQRDLKRLQR